MTTHIHLLAEDFRENRHPTKLVQDALNAQANQFKWRYQGAGLDGAKVKKLGESDLSNIYSRIIQKNIEADDGLYRESEAFMAELKAFLKTNYDLE